MNNMQNKKPYIGMGIAMVLIGIAAFVAGRMFNGRVGIVGLGGRNSGQVSISLNDITPAPELPITTPEVTGMFVERKDDTVIISSFSFDPGVGGMSGDTPIDTNSGPKIEIVVTNATTIYRETTDFGQLVPSEHYSIQQTVEEATLDDINDQSTVIVWGHRSGDRVTADVLFYSNPLLLKK
jgi:hypothetical protein